VTAPDDAPLVPLVAVLIHPINVEQHPTYPPGWRWAVYVGGRPPADIDYCANAGHAATEVDAAVAGESHGAAVVRGLRLMGYPAAYRTQFITWDPIPATADDRPLVIVREGAR